MSSMIQRVNVPRSEMPAWDSPVYTTSFPQLNHMIGSDTIVAHDRERLDYSRLVLGGARFGGMFEVIDSPLSQAETRILALRALGFTTDLLVDTLFVAEATIRTQQKAAIHKLGVTSISAAIAVGFQGDTPFFVPVMHGPAQTDIRPAEKQVVQHLAQGLSPQEIADHRGCSIATVRVQIKDSYGRLGIPGDNHASLVTLAHLTSTVFDHDAT